MTAITATAAPVRLDRKYVAAGTFVLLGLVDIVLFGMLAHKGSAVFSFPGNNSAGHPPSVSVPAATVSYILGALSIAAGVARATLDLGRGAVRALITVALLAFLFSLLCWADAGNQNALDMVNLLQGSISASIPLILGALSGLMGERAGVINIAIEGQFLVGAFTAAAVASAVGSVWLGLVSGSLAGGLVGAVLAVFAIKYFVDQIIIGVVLNVLAIGLTNYLYDRIMQTYANTFNAGNTFPLVKIPVLGDIPVIGPVFFDSTVLLYITYVLIIVIQVAMFSTRWGLRVRAVGEHPTAADTVGINVLWIRYRNLILGGMVAGIGGVFLTTGSVGLFNKNISSGYGFIALAAMIFGRWKPLGALAASLLFGFALQLQNVLSTLNSPVPSDFLLMAPYVATIIAVAGLVGKVRAPAADGKPYVKA